jgi:hypothetical protein
MQNQAREKELGRGLSDVERQPVVNADTAHREQTTKVAGLK